MAEITIYTTPMCGFCFAAKKLLKEKGAEFTEIGISGDPDARQAMMTRSNGRHTVPQIFFGDRHIGGCDDLYDLDASGELDTLLAS